MKQNLKLLIESLFDDIYDDENNDLSSEIVDEYMSQQLEYNTKLSPTISNVLGIPKPTGFKLEKSDNNNYEKFVYTGTSYFKVPKYVRELVNKLDEYNWKFYDLTIPDTSWKNNEIITKYIEKYENDTDKIQQIAISPDEDLLYIQKQLNAKTSKYYWERKLQFILTFSGKVTKNIIFNNKENKEILKQAKLNKTHIQNFKKFIKKFNGLINFTAYPINIDKDNYPYLIISKNDEQSFKTLYHTFKSAYYYYKESNEHLDSESKWEIISVNNNFLRLYFYEPNNSIKYDKYVILIKLTNEGKQKFDSLFLK